MRTVDSYKTFPLGPIDDINECSRIVLIDSRSDTFGMALSPYTANDILQGLLEDQDEHDFIWRNGDSKFVHEDTGEFDAIIYISQHNTALGYTKFNNRLGGRAITIELNLTSTNLEDPEVFTIVTTVPEQTKEKEQRGWYEDSLMTISEARERKEESYRIAPWSHHISSNSDIFLSNYSVLQSSGVVANLDFPKSKELISNPYKNYSGVNEHILTEYTFDNYSVGFYGGSDIVLNSWSDNCFSIVSLLRTDDYGKPIYYVVTKEGRKPFNERYENLPTTIEYISGRYLLCKTSAQTIRVWDTVNEKWLKTEKAAVISDPQDPCNRLYELSNLNGVTLEEYKKSIPYLRYICFRGISEDTKFKSIRLHGTWVILEPISGDSCYLSGLYDCFSVKKSDLDSGEYIFLNSRSILRRSDINSGIIYSTEMKDFHTNTDNSKPGKKQFSYNPVGEEYFGFFGQLIKVNTEEGTVVWL